MSDKKDIGIYMNLESLKSVIDLDMPSDRFNYAPSSVGGKFEVFLGDNPIGWAADEWSAIRLTTALNHLRELSI